MNWVLVMYIYAGMLARGDSVAIHSVPMASEGACEGAAAKAKKLVDGSTKEFRYACLRVTP